MKKLLVILLCIPFICVGQTWDVEGSDRYNIIGWSKDGLVAYTLFYSNHDETHGIEDDYYEDYSLNIQDLKTDEILDGLDIGGSISYYMDYMLDEYNIIVEPSKFYNYYDEGSIFITEQDYFIDIFDDVVHDINEDCFYPELNGHVLNCTTHVFINFRSRRKHVGSLESEECYSSFSLTGYYISPFEDRILLVFNSVQSEEGEMSDTKFEFIGCSLNPSTFK